MDLDQDYIEYVAESSLALLAISAAYFLDPSKPITFTSLLLIPVIYGYTTYISRERFSPASFLSFVTLIFIPISPLMGFIALFIPISNVLISISASGTGFKNYSNATLLPMIITGFLMGGMLYGAAQTQPEIRQTIINNVEDITSKQASVIIEQTQLEDIQQDASQQIVKSTSSTTILLTKNYVMNRTDFNRRQRQELSEAFNSAQETIPQRFSKRIEERSQGLNISDQAARGATNLIRANFGILILIASLSFYAINPLISILTGLSGLLFQKMAERL